VKAVGGKWRMERKESKKKRERKKKKERERNIRDVQEAEINRRQEDLNSQVSCDAYSKQKEQKEQ
jgi:hypothetical protein